jgi:hypothetical protein
MPSGLRQPSLALAWLVMVLWGCFDDRSRPTVPVLVELTVLSDPDGAEIFLDGDPLGRTTPATLAEVPAGRHRLLLELSAAPTQVFGWADTVTVPEEPVDTIDAALQGGCRFNCPLLVDRGRIRCLFNNYGDTCASVFFDLVPALEWPGASGADYGAGGRLLVAAVLDDDAGAQAGDTVATQVYEAAWVGRRPVASSSSVRRQMERLEYWATSLSDDESLLGLSVSETVVAVDSAGAEDVLFINLEVHNVSGDERYRYLYPSVPEGGYTFRELYLGFGLDPDVGGADDDVGTFDPDLNLAFVYDADFSDAELGDFAERPALVGLVTVEPPAGAMRRTLTLWRVTDDWDGEDRQDFAWRLLAGRLQSGDPIGDHPSPDIGHASNDLADYRVTEAYGPLRLAPGEMIEMTVALVLAEPVAGTFTPGARIPPGDPTDPARTILDVAADLRALAAELPDLWARYRP